jgi:hypothetical protein
MQRMRNSTIVALQATKWIGTRPTAMIWLAAMAFAQQTNRPPAASTATQSAKQPVASPSATSSRHAPGEVSSVVLPGGVKLEMVFLSPGTFQMGNAPLCREPRQTFRVQ